MDFLCERLNSPQTFEDMTLVLRNKGIIDKVKEILPTNISPRIFLSAWLISRFPEILENTEDSPLKKTADAVVACSKNGYNIIPVLELFKIRFTAWKENDIDKLKEELLEKYTNIHNKQLENPQSSKILLSTKDELLTHAFNIGGVNFVAELLSAENLHK